LATWELIGLPRVGTPAKAPLGRIFWTGRYRMADNSGGGGGGLYFIVGALVVVVAVIGFVAFGGHMPRSGGGGSAPSKVELNVNPSGK
jgi:hypothetical protein